ncbi:MAG: carbonic anhydrase [Pseudomonadota bacterium]
MRTFPLKLLDGYKGFRSAVSNKGTYEPGRLAREGQNPDIMVVACCDSRVTPELIFSADPGSLFVVRNIANIIPPHVDDGRNMSTAAALEFAVQALRVKHIVILGHAHCGGIRAAVDGAAQNALSEHDYLGRWIGLLGTQVMEDANLHAHDHDCDPVPAAGHDDVATRKYRAVEEAGIRASLENLRSFSCVRQALAEGTLSLHGAWFDIEKGELWVMDGPSGEFHWTDGIDFR